MRTYILSRNMAEIPFLMLDEDRTQQARDAVDLCRLVMGVDKLEDSRQLGIPAVMMWDEYHYALLNYAETFIESIVHSSLHTELDERLLPCWELTYRPEHTYAFEIKDPVRTATDKMIASHFANLVSSNPVAYGAIYPSVTDLSQPFIEEW